jgi:site-specific recombinase XerD
MVEFPIITDELTAFVTELERPKVSPTTLKSYRSDLRLFARWFTEAISEAFVAAAITPTGLRDY